MINRLSLTSTAGSHQRRWRALLSQGNNLVFSGIMNLSDEKMEIIVKMLISVLIVSAINRGMNALILLASTFLLTECVYQYDETGTTVSGKIALDAHDLSGGSGHIA